MFVTLIYVCLHGQGKFNLFEGETSKKQNVAARLSSVLGIPVEKEKDASSLAVVLKMASITERKRSNTVIAKLLNM